MSANRMTLPVSMSVMTYNQEQLVEQAVSSAMAQEYNGPLEILISDDCSTDDTLNILKDLISGYSGPHSIRLNVNDRNMGLIPHMHKVFAMPKYDFQVCMAGDDISKPDRVMRLAKITSRPVPC